jgi:hypothetical protein
MRVDKEKSDSLTEWALQDLLIDVAAVVAATEPDRTRNASDLTRSESGASWKFSPAWQTCSTAE